MIGLALSGGGSRAIAFHLGCLSALSDLGILDNVGVLSTISGGSVIGALYAYSPTHTFEQFDHQVRDLLRQGFHRKIMVELLLPQNLLPSLFNFALTKSEALLCLYNRQRSQRYPTRTDCFAKVLERDFLTNLTMSSARRRDLKVVIGSCDLPTGSAFRFTNHSAGGWRHGEAVDWDVPVSFAVAASAAYPLLLPALDRTWRFSRNGIEETRRILLTDGGVYDNLGASVLMPGRNPDVSIHTFDCEYLIICSAGHGQDSGAALPLGWLGRVRRSFSVIHRRVQDSTMRSLHEQKEAGLIRGFVLPYLGQQDHRLPIRPADLVPRSAVAGYPTNFAPMSEYWIDTLAKRGEQLTRSLVAHYIPAICS